MNREPLVTVSTITALVAAVIGLLVAFGIPLTGDQQTAILAVVAVVAPLVVAAVARGKVTPVSKAVPISNGQPIVKMSADAAQMGAEGRRIQAALDAYHHANGK